MKVRTDALREAGITHHKLVCCLQTRTHRTANNTVLGEDIRQAAEEGLERSARFREVDEQVGRLGQEDVVGVGDDEHSAVSGSGRHREEVEGDVVADDGGHRAPVVRPGDRSEVLLACGVPDLHLDVTASHLDYPRRELASYRDLVLLPWFLLGEV